MSTGERTFATAAALGRGHAVPRRPWAPVPIRFDIPWLFALALGTWTLADLVLPSVADGRTAVTYWAAGFLGALGLGASLAVHEAAHCWAARRAGLATRGVVLSAFGGVAYFDDEPATARDALAIAAAGPLANILTAAIAGAVAAILVAIDADPLGTAIAVFIASGNLLIAAVNVIPAEPLDGGHALRALLGACGLEPLSAALVAGRAGRATGAALVGLTLVASISGDVPIALWSGLLALVVLIDR